MGCVVSSENEGSLSVSKSLKKLSIAGQVSIASTNGLQMLMQKHYLRDAFREFIANKWNPSIHGSAYYKRNGRNIALNCVDFLVDVQDFNLIKASPFLEFRACFLFEKYLMHGASLKIPASTNVLDECSEELFGEHNKSINSSLFSAAEGEALDFLIAEVYPHFENTSVSIAWGTQNQRRNQHLLGMLRAGAKAAMSSQRKLLKGDSIAHTALSKILRHKDHLALFKLFLAQFNAERILYCYNEAVELCEKLSELSAVREDDVRQTIFLHYINVFYDTYISLGSPYRIQMPEATYGDLMRRISSSKNNEQEALAPVIHELTERLSTGFVAPFLTTEEYRELVRSEQQTVRDLLHSAPHSPLSPHSPHSPHSPRSIHSAAERLSFTRAFLHSPSTAPPSPSSMSLQSIQSSQFGDARAVLAPSPLLVVNAFEDAELEEDEEEDKIKEGDIDRADTAGITPSVVGMDECVDAFVGRGICVDRTVVESLRELKSFMRSGYDGIFGRFLSYHCQLPLMHFYQSVTRYQEAYFNHEVEHIAESTIIFDRYISRNAEEPVDLPEFYRKDITKRLFRGEQDLYLAAAEWTLLQLGGVYWPMFKVEVISSADNHHVLARAPTGAGSVAGAGGAAFKRSAASSGDQRDHRGSNADLSGTKGLGGAANNCRVSKTGRSTAAASIEGMRGKIWKKGNPECGDDGGQDPDDGTERVESSTDSEASVDDPSATDLTASGATAQQERLNSETSAVSSQNSLNSHFQAYSEDYCSSTTDGPHLQRTRTHSLHSIGGYLGGPRRGSTGGTYSARRASRSFGRSTISARPLPTQTENNDECHPSPDQRSSSHISHCAQAQVQDVQDLLGRKREGRDGKENVDCGVRNDEDLCTRPPRSGTEDHRVECLGGVAPIAHTQHTQQTTPFAGSSCSQRRALHNSFFPSQVLPEPCIVVTAKAPDAGSVPAPSAQVPRFSAHHPGRDGGGVADGDDGALDVFEAHGKDRKRGFIIDSFTQNVSEFASLAAKKFPPFRSMSDHFELEDRLDTLDQDLEVLATTHFLKPELDKQSSLVMESFKRIIPALGDHLLRQGRPRPQQQQQNRGQQGDGRGSDAEGNHSRALCTAAANSFSPSPSPSGPTESPLRLQLSRIRLLDDSNRCSDGSVGEKSPYEERERNSVGRVPENITAHNNNDVNSTRSAVLTLLKRHQLHRQNTIGALKITRNASLCALTSANFGEAFRRFDNHRQRCRYSARDVLDNAHCCSVFKEFLDHEGMAQTLLFFAEIEEFRRIPSVDFQFQRAKKIFNKFVHSLAILPIPITASVREEIRQHIEDRRIIPTLFKAAADEVISYIERFQFPRFEASPGMRSVIGILNMEAGIAAAAAAASGGAGGGGGSGAEGGRGGIFGGVEETGYDASARRNNSSASIYEIHIGNLQSLREVLKYQTTTRYFKDFCCRTICEENILFWLDVDNYMHLPGSDYMRRVACKIYKKYIADNARKQINISYHVKQKVFENLQNAHRMLFKRAQDEVFRLMEQDTMRKFLCSQEFGLLQKNIELEQSGRAPAGKFNG